MGMGDQPVALLGLLLNSRRNILHSGDLVMVLTSLNSDSTAAFLEPNAIKKLPMESGT